MISVFIQHFQQMFTQASSHYQYGSKQEYYGRYLDSLPFEIFGVSDSLLTQCKKLINQSTSIPIYINGLKFGSGILSVMLKMRNPKAIFRHSGYKHTYKILFYKIKILKYPSILQLHFYKNRLFYGKYVMGHDKSSCIESLPKLLSMKYEVPCLDSTNVLTDADGNLINFKVHSNFEINYYSNIGIFEELQQELVDVQEKAEKRKRYIFNRDLSKV